MSGFETITVGDISGDLTFSGQNASDIEKIAMSADSGANASFYNMGTNDLTVESVGKTTKSLTTDNEGVATLDYKATEEATSAETSSASFEFVKAKEAVVNVDDNVAVTGSVKLDAAEKANINVEATNSSFSGILDADKVVSFRYCF